jgi:hypothetical protein
VSRPTLDVDLFAGPGGWDEGVAPLGMRPVEFEWDSGGVPDRDGGPLDWQTTAPLEDTA